MDKAQHFGLGYMVGAALALTLTFLLFILLGGLGLTISEETAIKICQELSNETDVEFQVETLNGDLICKRPTFDNTHRIKFEGGGE